MRNFIGCYIAGEWIGDSKSSSDGFLAGSVGRAMQLLISGLWVQAPPSVLKLTWKNKSKRNVLSIMCQIAYKTVR